MFKNKFQERTQRKILLFCILLPVEAQNRKYNYTDENYKHPKSMGEYDWYSRSKLIGSLKLEDWFKNPYRTKNRPGLDPDWTKTKT